ncbi:MAG: TipAS antibiotic-recognition domain-containing protein [Acetatifactor sp.]|nr:TipAS antibiotic-recognition domain-containing protein [Acetatifactor sp.]
MQAQVRKLQEYISANYYTCSDEILSSLGEMYIGDDRFRKNIDNAGGDGTAKYTHKAIEAFCRKE